MAKQKLLASVRPGFGIASDRVYKKAGYDLNYAPRPIEIEMDEKKQSENDRALLREIAKFEQGKGALVFAPYEEGAVASSETETLNKRVVELEKENAALKKELAAQAKPKAEK